MSVGRARLLALRYHLSTFKLQDTAGLTSAVGNRPFFMTTSFANSPLPTPTASSPLIRTAGCLIIGYVLRITPARRSRGYLTYDRKRRDPKWEDCGHQLCLLCQSSCTHNHNLCLPIPPPPGFSQYCFELGIDLKRIEVIADDQDEM